MSLNRLNPSADLGTNGARGQLNETLELMAQAIRRLQAEGASKVAKAFNLDTGKFEEPASSVQTHWVRFNPIWSWTVNAADGGSYWRRRGPNLEFNLNINLSGVPTPDVALTADILTPLALTLDEDGSPGVYAFLCGIANVYEAATDSDTIGTAIQDKAISGAVVLKPKDGPAIVPSTYTGGPFAADDAIGLLGSIPIKEWRNE